MDRSRLERGIYQGKSFSLTFVCSGNRFRSPVAAGFMRAYLASEPITVSSAGVRDYGEAGALSDAVELAGRLGVDVSAHRSRTVASLDLSGIDLVLCFERTHLASAVVEGGARSERAFLFLELLELLEDLPEPAGDGGVERARRLVAGAAAARPDRLWPEARYEFPDPLAGPRSDYPAIVARLQELCLQLSERLFGVPTAQRTSVM
ncbi:hypothetical protein BH18ACT15_BH18ACT15_13680 [soil metagenome]